MKIITRPLLSLLIAMHAQVAWSTDACSTRAVTSTADVTVSDGSSFRTESFFHSRDASAIRHVRDSERVIAVEGPLGWTSEDGSVELGTNFHKLFSLGHQFHALLLYFEEIATNVRRNNEIEFGDGVHGGMSGDYPYGGVVHLIDSNKGSRPAGLLFEFPETPKIAVTFDDWRENNGHILPYELQIDDGERIFNYHYSAIDIAPRSPLWFFGAIDAPAIDQVQVYRLHRRLLAAHCLGDADLMSELSAPEIVTASRGELQLTTNHSMRDRFTDLFQRSDYVEYHDIATPVIETSVASDLGWIGVNVRAVGSDKVTGASFDDQWAWLMIVKKIDNVWVHAGNASNLNQ